MRILDVLDCVDVEDPGEGTAGERILLAGDSLRDFEAAAMPLTAFKDFPEVPEAVSKRGESRGVFGIDKLIGESRRVDLGGTRDVPGILEGALDEGFLLERAAEGVPSRSEDAIPRVGITGVDLGLRCEVVAKAEAYAGDVTGTVGFA